MAMTDRQALEALLAGKTVVDSGGDSAVLDSSGTLVGKDGRSFFLDSDGFGLEFSHVLVATDPNKHRAGSWKWARHEFDKNGRNIKNTFGDTRYYRADWKDFDDLSLEGIELRSKCVWSTF